MFINDGSIAYAIDWYTVQIGYSLEAGSSGHPCHCYQASTSFSTEVPVETNVPRIFMTGAGPVNIFKAPIKSSPLAKPATAATINTKTAAKAATTPAVSNEAMFVNDGSIDYAIELAKRLPFAEIPKLDMKWPSSAVSKPASVAPTTVTKTT